MAITPRTLWLAAALVAGLASIAIVLSKAIGVVILLFIAIIVAEGIRPLVAGLHKLRVPRALGVLLVYLAGGGVLAALVWLLLRPLLSQLATFISDLPQYLAATQRQLTQAQQLVGKNPQAGQLVNQLGAQIGGIVGAMAQFLLRLPLTIVDLLFNSILVLLMAFFWLTTIDDLKPFVVGLFPPRAQATAASVLHEMGRKIGGYLRGVVVNMAVIGMLSGLGDWVLGVPYPLLLGILAGLTEIIPFIGPFLGGAVAALLALVAVGPVKALEVVVLYVLIQQIEGNALVPLVMNRVVELNPLTVVVAVLLGGALLGLIGGVVGVPAAVAIQVLVVRVLAPAARRASARIAERETQRSPARSEGTTASVP